MKRFKKVLVGVDLLQGDRLVGDHPTPSAVHALDRALWLARQNGAQVRLLYALDVPANVQRMILQNADMHNNLLTQANNVMSTLLEPFTKAGVQADHQVVFGRSWMELVRSVLRDQHDLLIAGTRQLNPVARVIFGSTGMKLLRKCPCPVWLTQPDTEPELRSILVAHDLSEVGSRALELGAGMAEMCGAPLHVLHAVDNQDYGVEYTRLVHSTLAERESQARQQLETELSHYNLSQPAQIHIANQSPEEALLAHIEKHQTEVLVMGTVSRSGIPGLLMGNTAERLLPNLTCSIVAIKPDGFQTPITV